TPLDESDDQFRLIDNAVENGSLEFNATAIAEELDEEIWIGTERGIYVIYNPEDLFEEDGEIEAQRIKIEQDGNIEFLLENEFITAIAIDGGNRKWIGTQSSGVFVLSPDGIDQIHQFTLENSPLLSNTINDIAIDEETGEVFFSTDQGLVSYKGIATKPKEAFIDVYAYPNPVPPGYSGTIGIKGLMFNTDIRITDITGNTVYAAKSLGGQATWDGNKLDGTRASSGVYLVFLTNEDGTSDEVTKILFMK
ncbi:MAG: T9SS type A sorting domain-containing protein, partial [Flavobacteriales bacterium]